MAEDRQPPDRDLCSPGQLYKDLVEDAVVGVYITAVDGRFLYANRAAASMLGYASVDELTSAGVEALYRDLEQRRQLLRKLAETGEVRGYDVEVVTPQGEPRHLSISARLAGGFMRGMILDVTEQRRAEEALWESEERFRVLFDRQADMVCIVAYDGKIMEANPAAIEQTGCSMEELSRLDVMRDLAADEPSLAHETLVESLRRGETVHFEERRRRKDGTLCWTECTLSPCICICKTSHLCCRSTRASLTASRLRYSCSTSAHDSPTGVYNCNCFEHATDDRVLRHACQVLRAAFRAEDMLARIGGDEFVVLLPEMDEAEALRMLERVRESNLGLRSPTRMTRRHSQHRTGVATVAPQKSLEGALRLAGARMYGESRGSGNRSPSFPNRTTVNRPGFSCGFMT